MTGKKMRTRADALIRNTTGALFLGDQIYSGLAYNVTENGIVTSIDIVDQGQITGASGDWYDLPRGGVRVDRAFLDEPEDYGPLLHYGDLVTGVVYSFSHHGPCESEEEYEQGSPSGRAERSWHHSGAPQHDFANDQGTAWFENGHLKAKIVNGETLLNLVERDGTLTAVVVRDAALFDIASMGGFAIGSNFVLTGAGIDEGLIQMLVDNTNLADVTSLRLNKTSISPDFIQLAIVFHKLKKLDLSGNAAFEHEMAELIRARLPNCAVNVHER